MSNVPRVSAGTRSSNKRPAPDAQPKLEQPLEFTFTFTPPLTPTSEAASPASTRGSPALRAPSPKKSKTDPGHVRRPPNPFILFRSDLIARESKNIGERDFKNVSRIAGLLWRNLPPDEKKRFQDTAEQLKRDHAATYPDWIYRPEKREKRKRKVYGNGPEKMAQLETIAALMSTGLSGDGLSKAVKTLPTIQEERPKKRRRGAAAKEKAHTEPMPTASSSSSSPSLTASPFSTTSSFEEHTPPMDHTPSIVPSQVEYDYSVDYETRYNDIAGNLNPPFVDNPYSLYNAAPEADPYYDGQLFVGTMAPTPDYGSVESSSSYNPSGYAPYEPYASHYNPFQPQYDASAVAFEAPLQWNVDIWSVPY